ncbi:DUF7860 family protein [Halorientalis salina]|jgi:hypothetical protein|uniref:DUF7860 family protein n=1 Tax=Halorientalis salina TaxID=2932266 RepID=UPI0010AC87CC|nr:hypothetical protein [Halorientalis salina]
MARTNSIDYPTWTKRSFLFGVSLFLGALLVDVVGGAVFGPLPAWGQTLFVDLEFLGIFIALLAPLVFGIVLPLVE